MPGAPNTSIPVAPSGDPIRRQFTDALAVDMLADDEVSITELHDALPTNAAGAELMLKVLEQCRAISEVAYCLYDALVVRGHRTLVAPQGATELLTKPVIDAKTPRATLPARGHSSRQMRNNLVAIHFIVAQAAWLRYVAVGRPQNFHDVLTIVLMEFATFRAPLGAAEFEAIREGGQAAVDVCPPVSLESANAALFLHVRKLHHLAETNNYEPAAKAVLLIDSYARRALCLVSGLAGMSSYEDSAYEVWESGFEDNAIGLLELAKPAMDLASGAAAKKAQRDILGRDGPAVVPTSAARAVRIRVAMTDNQLPRGHDWFM